MNNLSIVEIAKLTAAVEGGGFKRQATKDSAQTAFNDAAKAKGLKLADNWANGLTFKEAEAKLRDMLNGGEKPAGKKGKAAPAPAAGKKGKAAPAPAAEKKGKQAAKAKVAKKKQDGAKGGGRHGNRDKPLIVVTKTNPYRSGASKATYDAILKTPGKTFRDYVKAGGRANTIAGAIRDGHLKVSDKAA